MSAKEIVAAIVRDLEDDADKAEASNRFDIAITILRDKAKQIKKKYSGE